MGWRNLVFVRLLRIECVHLRLGAPLGDGLHRMLSAVSAARFLRMYSAHYQFIRPWLPRLQAQHLVCWLTRRGLSPI